MIDIDHQTVIEDLMDAVVVADADGLILWINPAAERLLGWSRNDLVGLPLTTIQPERMRGPHLSGFHRYQRTHEPRLIGSAIRVPALRRDGTELDIELTLTSQRSPDGDELFVGRLRDVRDQVDLERQLDTSRHLATVADVATRLRAQDGAHSICTIVAEAMVSEFSAAAAQVWLADDAADEPTLCGQARKGPADDPVLSAGACPEAVRQVTATASLLWGDRSEDGATLFLPLLLDDAVQGVLAARFAQPVSEDLVGVLTTFATLVGARIAGARSLAREQEARRASEGALERMAFLAEAGRILSSSLDYEGTLAEVARLAVPALADWCVVDIADADGRLQRVTVAHTDPDKEQLAWELVRRYPTSPDTSFGPASVHRTGQSELFAAIQDSQLAETAQDAEHLRVLREVGLTSYMAVPLQARGRTVGVLSCVVARSGRVYGPDDVAFLQQLAANAALAVDNSRLFADLRTANEANTASLAQLDTFFASAPVGLAFLDTELRYLRVNDTLASITGEPVDTLLGHTATEVLGEIGRRADRLRREVLATGRPLRHAQLSGTTRRDPRRIRHWTVDYYPVRTDADELLGLGVIVEDVTERVDAEQALSLQQRFLTAVLENLKDGIVACDATGDITVFNRATQEFHGLAVGDVPPDQWAQHYQLLMPDGTTGMTPGDIPLSRALRGEVVRDVEMVIAPEHADRRVVLCNGQALHDDEGRKLGAVVAMHDVTQRKQAEAKLTRQALHDPLTALPNRVLLLDRMRQALARSGRLPGSVAVLFLDFDRFKVVNDSLGHDLGDQVLIAIAERLRSVVRPADTVARMGGDEFVVLCENVSGEHEVVRLCQRLQAAIAAAPLLVTEGTEVVMTASVGVAMAEGDERPEDILRNADAAMYRAKERGKARHEIYDDSFRAAAVNRLRTENALRRAIEQEALELLYQPIVDLGCGRIVAAEALVRYHDPHRGLVPPGEFLEVAEDTGLIVPMGNWIIAEACRQLARWRRMPGAEGLRVSINLSARQLADAQLAPTLERALTRERLPSGAVALEITESVLIEAADSTLRVLDRLKDVGAQLGIDDFGTGYSSLTYLRRFPVDFLKIDQSFVAGLGADQEDTAIVTAVAGLGKSLGLVTVAEGVETSDQLATLRELRCDRGQGYHFARPQPPDAFTSLVARRDIF